MREGRGAHAGILRPLETARSEDYGLCKARILKNATHYSSELRENANRSEPEKNQNRRMNQVNRGSPT